MGHVLARDPAALSQFPPPHPHLLPVFCEPSVSNGMLLSLIWLVKVSHRAKNSVTKTSQNLFFYYFIADGSLLLSLGSSGGWGQVLTASSVSVNHL